MDCSICVHIPPKLRANTGRDEYLPSTVDPLKRMELGYRSDEDLWRCPECGAIYEYYSEQCEFSKYCEYEYSSEYEYYCRGICSWRTP